MNTSRTGDALEKSIYALFQNEIDADRFWAKKESCKVFWRKGYHSKDRGSDIIFDVSIELYLPGEDEFSALVLIECKNYAHPVPVDDAEEFFSKVQQVAAANAKAVIASTASFQSGTCAFAKSKGIGLIRYFDATNFKWELKRSASATARSISVDDSYHVIHGLSHQDFRSEAFDLYLQSPARETNSLWDFIEDLVLDTALDSDLTRHIENPRSKLSNQVPFLEKDDIENRSAVVLSEIGYASGEVKLDEICARERERSNLVVRTEVAREPAQRQTTLGRIIFDPLTIEVYAQGTPNRGRERFTLAHELAHHLLSHGKYLVSESCDDSDFALERRSVVNGSDVSRMEYQANFLAACLLMPRTNILQDVYLSMRALGLTDKGFGPLYVDDQPCNLETFEFVTGKIMQKYAVSRTAARIRLQSLGLLHDVRPRSGLNAMQNILAYKYQI